MSGFLFLSLERKLWLRQSVCYTYLCQNFGNRECGRIMEITTLMFFLFSARVSVEDEEEGLNMTVMEEEHPLVTIKEGDESETNLWSLTNHSLHNLLLFIVFVSSSVHFLLYYFLSKHILLPNIHVTWPFAYQNVFPIVKITNSSSFIFSQNSCKCSNLTSSVQRFFAKINLWTLISQAIGTLQNNVCCWKKPTFHVSSAHING